MVQSMRSIFSNIQEESELTQKQLFFYRKLTKVSKLIEKIKIQFHNQVITLEKLVNYSQEQFQEFIAADPYVHMYQSAQNASSVLQLIDLSSELQNDLITDIKRPSKCCDFIKWFVRQKYIGTLQTMRAELKLRYNSQQIWIKTGEGHKIDAVFIPCQQRVNQASSSPGSGQQEIQCQYPLMITCNPNAGFYQFIYYQNEWIDYYNQMGIDVLAWNYRGFGRVKGSPTPANICSDAQQVYDYAKRDLKYQRIGIHGESLGGNVACHLARHCDVKFLFADRTFASLSKIVESKCNRWLMYLVKFVTCGWEMNGSQDYVYAKCYKVVSNSQIDQIINQGANLKNGISQKIVQIELENAKKKMMRKWKVNKQQNSVIRKRIAKQLMIEKYTHFLQQNELKSLLVSLQKLREICDDFDQVGGSPFGPSSKFNTPSKVPSKPLNGDADIHQIQEDSDDIKKSNVDKKYFILSPDEEDKEINSAVVNQGNNQFQRTDEQIAQNSSKLSEKVKYSDQFDKAKNFKLKLNKKLLGNENHKSLKKVLKKYEKSTEMSQMKTIYNVAKQMYHIYDNIDSGGISLQNILRLPKRKQFARMKMFLINLQIWGSCFPQKIQNCDMVYTRECALNLVTQFNNSFRYCIRELNLSVSDIQSEKALTNQIKGHCEIILHFFCRIQQQLEQKSKFKQLSQSPSSFKIQSQQEDQDVPRSTATGSTKPFQMRNVDFQQQQSKDEQLKNAEEEQQRLDTQLDQDDLQDDDDRKNRNIKKKMLPSAFQNEITKKVFDSKSSSPKIQSDSYVSSEKLFAFKQFSQPDVSRTGFFISILSGHHGNMNNVEKNIYELHLQNAQFIQEQY